MSDKGCEEMWEFDVDFWAMCVRHYQHLGPHRAIIEGNDGVVARIEWPEEAP